MRQGMLPWLHRTCPKLGRSPAFVGCLREIRLSSGMLVWPHLLPFRKAAARASDRSRLPVVFIRTNADAETSINDQIEALLEERRPFVLVTDHAPDDHEEERRRSARSGRCFSRGSRTDEGLLPGHDRHRWRQADIGRDQDCGGHGRKGHLVSRSSLRQTKSEAERKGGACSAAGTMRGFSDLRLLVEQVPSA